MISCLKDHTGDFKCFSFLATNSYIAANHFPGHTRVHFSTFQVVFDLHPFAICQGNALAVTLKLGRELANPSQQTLSLVWYCIAYAKVNLPCNSNVTLIKTNADIMLTVIDYPTQVSSVCNDFDTLVK